MTKKQTKQSKYTPEAYELVLEALNATAKMVDCGEIVPNAPYADDRAIDENPAAFHISGRELLEGFKIHVRRQYGNMALLLLERWGLKTTEDVGNIVFEMVEAGRMSKRETDSIDDFKNGYDFAEAFTADDNLED
ncbi:MAG: Minf_1886 family protein [Planctomycetota bacterium]|jgi:uncharacterized repeat protein (TIGR04138 family)